MHRALAVALVVFSALEARAAVVGCSPTARRVIDIDDVSPDDPVAHDAAMRTIIQELNVPDTVVVLGPNVHIDFRRANADEVPVVFERCTALISRAARSSLGNNDIVAPIPLVSGRTPSSTGPLLEYGPVRGEDERELFLVSSKYSPHDSVRISGLRLYGPSFGQQHTGEAGIHIIGSVDVEISNMEIAGWGGAGVSVDDLDEGGRIDDVSDVRVVNSYIHHNQHPRTIADDGTAGYGVVVSDGAYAEIVANVFDSNRHAIAASGYMDGYDAIANLVLKGGGVHYDGFFTTIHTHQFDIHGTGDDGFGGRAGGRTLFAYNSFQYINNEAISIRGLPEEEVVIRDNVFVHDDVTDDAIALDTTTNVDIQTNNIGGYDSYGTYRVCDFDGDEIDDLFLATGQTWWFSSYGEFQWTYLATRIETQDQLRFGYFDADNKCDVLTQGSDGDWVISSGGVGWWQSIGNYGQALNGDVEFGRFDPNDRDERAGANKRTTHAFRKVGNTWQVTPLTALTTPVVWTHAQTSRLAMRRLRFGDFTGDGVTDVLAVRGGGWSISDGARGSWERINSLHDDVGRLLIVDLDHDNIDDLVRVRRLRGGGVERYAFEASYGGRTAWQPLTNVALPPPNAERGAPVFVRAGRFGSSPGGGVLIADHARRGHFYSAAEVDDGRHPSWLSLYPY